VWLTSVGVLLQTRVIAPPPTGGSYRPASGLSVRPCQVTVDGRICGCAYVGRRPEQHIRMFDGLFRALVSYGAAPVPRRPAE
jgi:hypothetical protein